MPSQKKRRLMCGEDSPDNLRSVASIDEAVDLNVFSCRKVLEDTKLMHKQKKRRAVSLRLLFANDCHISMLMAWHMVIDHETCRALMQHAFWVRAAVSR